MGPILVQLRPLGPGLGVVVADRLDRSGAIDPLVVIFSRVADQLELECNQG
jgi:hypothetical protein